MYVLDTYHPVPGPPRHSQGHTVRALAVAHSCSGLLYPSRLFGRATIKYRSGSNHTDTAGLCSSVPQRASGEVSADESRSARPRVLGGDGATLARLGGGSRPSLRARSARAAHESFMWMAHAGIRGTPGERSAAKSRRLVRAHTTFIAPFRERGRIPQDGAGHSAR